MLMMQYTHRLPADYDMERILQRAAVLAPDWRDAGGLGFKAFLTQRGGTHGAIGNTYSSLYLWLDDEAATDFVTGDRFKQVVVGFGRPAIETWLPLHISLGAATTARAAYREDMAIEPACDLAQLKRAEAERSGRAARAAGVFASIVALDFSTWRLTRFLLTADAARTPQRGAAYDIVQFARPGMPALVEAA